MLFGTPVRSRLRGRLEISISAFVAVDCAAIKVLRIGAQQVIAADGIDKSRCMRVTRGAHEDVDELFRKGFES